MAGDDTPHGPGLLSWHLLTSLLGSSCRDTQMRSSIMAGLTTYDDDDDLSD